MSVEQITIIIFITIVMVLSVWNLVLSLQNRKIEKIKEEKKDYYGRLK